MLENPEAHSKALRRRVHPIGSALSDRFHFSDGDGLRRYAAYAPTFSQAARLAPMGPPKTAMTLGLRTCG